MTRHRSQQIDWRIECVRWGMVFFVLLIVLRLIVLQVIDHDVYQALASGQHQIFEELYPHRGDVLIHDLKDGSLLPIATNQQLAFVYADPRRIERPERTAQEVGTVLGWEDERIEALAKRLDQPEDPYEPIQRHVSDGLLAKITELELPGIYFVREETRLYPEDGLGGHLIGFVGANEDGTYSGKYGVEGAFDELLAGTPGFLHSERDIAGRLIAVGERSVQRAEDGANVVLTIDRTIQFMACRALKAAVARHGADGGSVVILDPVTGKIYAMCGAPDFTPSKYGEAASIEVFNNPAIFNAYEPGSIFKPITMAAALDTAQVTPSSTYEDTGEVVISDHTIKNSDEKAHGIQTMTQALEQSLNTGMIYAMRQAGQDTFVDYVKSFGFGERTGVELSVESPGNISSLDLGPEIYAATGSFGQGITVTPLQMAAAYGAIANGGVLKRPYLVEEVRYPDGRVEQTKVQEVRRVMEEKHARLLGAMLVAVIEHGHGGRAGAEGYYMAGKTGTAQVPRTDGKGYYDDVTIGSFAGFGPVEDPKFAMVVRIDHPKDVKWAESTAAPLFGEIGGFLLKYFNVEPTR